MKTINEYFSQSEKVSLISEYLLSKTKKPIGEPQCTWTIERIADWLETMGVTERVKFNMTFYRSEPNCLICEIGPKDHKNYEEYWVALIGNPQSKGDQRLVIKPKAKSLFEDIDEEETSIDFDKAIELAKEIIEDPTKVIKL